MLTSAQQSSLPTPLMTIQDLPPARPRFFLLPPHLSLPPKNKTHPHKNLIWISEQFLPTCSVREFWVRFPVNKGPCKPPGSRSLKGQQPPFLLAQLSPCWPQPPSTDSPTAAQNRSPAKVHTPNLQPSDTNICQVGRKDGARGLGVIGR